MKEYLYGEARSALEGVKDGARSAALLACRSKQAACARHQGHDERTETSPLTPDPGREETPAALGRCTKKHSP